MGHHNKTIDSNAGRPGISAKMNHLAEDRVSRQQAINDLNEYSGKVSISIPGALGGKRALSPKISNRDFD